MRLFPTLLVAGSLAPALPAQRIVAHGGASYEAPENTIAAFELAWDRGADAIEADVRLTVDGRVVCMHDASTERTADQNLVVADSTLADLLELDVGSWKGRRWRGERVPTLEEVLAVVPPGRQVFLEIKCGREILGALRQVLVGVDLEPERLLAAYAVGIFPMADEAGKMHWLAPDPRAIIKLEQFKINRSLRSVLRQGLFEITVNRAFPQVIRACADRAEGTWISDDIFEAYSTLHRIGFAHSVEAWKEGELAGGLYGVTMGGAFFGESMFHRITDASKIALAMLVTRMKQRGFVLLDVQFITQHLQRFGALEISREEYETLLHEAIKLPCRFDDEKKPASNGFEDHILDHG